MGHFNDDEQRYKKRENDIFEKMEDLLDEEHIRKTVDQVEKKAATPKKKRESGKIDGSAECSPSVLPTLPWGSWV